MSGTHAHLHPTPAAGLVPIPTTNLQPLASGAWADLATVVLPAPGTYVIAAQVRHYMRQPGGANNFMVARLVDGAGAQRVASILRAHDTVEAGDQDADQGTAPLLDVITVTAPTTLRVQAKRQNTTGDTSIAQIVSDANGQSRVLWWRLG